MAIARPAATATQFDPFAAVPPCANAGRANNIAAKTANTALKTRISVRIVFSYEIAVSGWLTLPCKRPHAKRLRNSASSFKFPVCASKTGKLKPETYLVVARDCSGQIYGRKKNKDVGLDECNADVQADKEHWHADRNQGKKNQDHHVTGKHVSVKPDGQRHDSCQVANWFYHQHQCTQRNSYVHRNGAVRRPQKMFEVSDTRMAETMRVVIDESAERASQRHNRNSSRRFETRNNSK